MRWKKHGIIYAPDTSLDWQKSHAALPTKLQISEDVYRIYFTSRDADNKTYVGYFDWEIGLPGKIINKCKEPVLKHGALGCFDDHGVQATSVVRVGDKIYLYYLGWNIGEPAPLFYTAIGLAISTDNGATFEKYSEAPIMERSKYDPWMVSGGTVLKEESRWRMWYISGISFGFENGVAKSKYDIKYAESVNGIDWTREGVVALQLQDSETNISRMSIIVENGLYKAWYPLKKEGVGYRVGYAESADGTAWTRMDAEVGIDVSEEGWDSEALDKMEVILNQGKKYMLYNGNSFGRDGIGLVILED
jgi:hypothetical protein